MSQTTIHIGQGANVPTRRLIVVPVLGAIVALIFAALMLLGIRAIENATSQVQPNGLLIPAIVLITYAAVGAFAATILFPARPYDKR